MSSSRMPSPAIRPRTPLGAARTLMPSRLGGVRSGAKGVGGALAAMAAPLAYNALMAKPETSGILSSQQDVSGQPIIPQ
jgi:hypothetical protein